MSDKPQADAPEAKVEDAPEATPEVVESMLPAPLQGSQLPQRTRANYADAIEAGKVLAASGLYPEYRDAAKAAVAVMIGVDLGVPATTAIRNIHALEDRNGKISFAIESKLMSALIVRHPHYGYRIVKRNDKEAVVEFTFDGKAVDDGEDGKITYTIEDAERAGLAGASAKSRAWKTNPRDMLFWRAISEGVRVYFPDLLAGQSLYLADADLGVDAPSDTPDLMAKLAPPTAQPLNDKRAEDLKDEMRAQFDRLAALNPTRVPPGLFANMLDKASVSHSQLEARRDHLKDMADVEEQYVEACEKLAEAIEDRDFKAIRERAERRSNGRERLAVITDAIEAALDKGEDKSEGGEGNGADGS